MERYKRIEIRKKDGFMYATGTGAKLQVKPAAPTPKHKHSISKLTSALTLSAVLGLGSLGIMNYIPNSPIQQAEQTEQAEPVKPQYNVPQDGAYLSALVTAAQLAQIADEFSVGGYEVSAEQANNAQRIYINPENRLESVVQHLEKHEKITPEFVIRKNGVDKQLNLDDVLRESQYARFEKLPYFQYIKQEVENVRKKRDIGDPGKFMAMTYALMEIESDFRPHLVSNKGAVGLMQVMPRSAALVDDASNVRKYHNMLFKAEKNIHYGIEILAEGVEFWRKREPDEQRARDLAAAEFNSGRKNTLQHYLDTDPEDQIPETRHYVSKARKAFMKYHGLSAPFYLSQLMR